MITDKQIMELAKSCGNIELPEVVETKIRNTYELIRNTKTSKGINKQIIAATISVILLGSIGLVYTNPTFAKAVSQVKSYFWDDKLEKYSSGLNVKAKDKGLELTVTEVVYDRDTISLVYTLKSDSPMNIEGDDLITMLPPNYGGREIKSKGAYINGWTYAGNEKIDENTYLIKEQLHCKGLIFSPSKEIKLDMNIDRLAGVEGFWHLSFTANTDTFGENSKDIVINKKLSFGNKSLKLTKVQITPLTSKLKFNNFRLPTLKEIFVSSSSSQDIYELEKKVLSISDDKGNGVISRRGAVTSDSIGTRGEYVFELNDEKLPEYIAVKPLKRITKEPVDYYRELSNTESSVKIPEVIYEKYLTHGTLDKLPVTIDGGRFGKAEIYDIVEKEDRFDFYMEVDSQYVTVFDGEIVLYDKTKEKSDFRAYPVRGNIFYPLGGKKYRFSLYQKEDFDISRLKDYVVCSWDIEKNYEIAGDEIRINIK
jgi:hypothetical protein